MAPPLHPRLDPIMRLLLTTPLALLGALLTAGCTTVSSHVLVPEALNVERSVGGSVSISTSGSPKRAYVMRPVVTAEAIQDALTAAIEETGIFDRIVSAGADRHLSVSVERIDEPEIGLDQTCTVTLRWRLATGDGSRTLWESRITTKRTLDFLDEFDPEARGQLAIEGALRLNLREGLEQLSQEG